MNTPSVYCEPFSIKGGCQFEIHHVCYLHDEDYSCKTHFHQVHEFICFERIEGMYIDHEGESILEDHDVVFTPSLETHNYELSERNKSWYILQISPQFFDQENLAEESKLLQKSRHFRLNKNNKEQLHTVLLWLLNSYNENPNSLKSLQLLRLAISLVLEGDQKNISQESRHLEESVSFNKIKPVADLFKKSSSVNLSLEEAAELCFLSPSHFARLFKKVFHTAYAKHALKHRLYHATRILGQTERSITEISYELNFSNPSYFISIFKRQYGITPKQYRNSLKERME